MYFCNTKHGSAVLALLSTLSCSASFAGSMGPVSSAFKGHFLAQIGGYSAIQGKAQTIHIAENLIGNRYTVTTHNQGNGLVGLGYLFDGPVIQGKFPLSYGINAFFLGQTSVRGYIIQEDEFVNLSYRYKVQHIPLYFVAKTVLDTKVEKLKLAVDAGIGPNFMSASHYREQALASFVVPDQAFSGRSNTTFSTTVGASLRFMSAPDSIPLECGYRFFYLGQGKFHTSNEQILNTVKTGDNYANAFVCTVTV